MTSGMEPDEGINGAVAAVLRGERAAVGMTIADLAEKSGVPAVTVQRLLAGRRPLTLAVLEQLANALGRTGADIHVDAQARVARLTNGVQHDLPVAVTRVSGER